MSAKRSATVAEGQFDLRELPRTRSQLLAWIASNVQAPGLPKGIQRTTITRQLRDVLKKARADGWYVRRLEQELSKLNLRKPRSKNGGRKARGGADSRGLNEVTSRTKRPTSDSPPGDWIRDGITHLQQARESFAKAEEALAELTDGLIEQVEQRLAEMTTANGENVKPEETRK